MELEILQQIDQPSFGRKAVEAKLSFSDATPSRAKIRSAAAKKLNVPSERIVVSSVRAKFGTQQAKVIMRVYEDVDSLKKLEAAYVHKRHGDDKKEEAAAPKVE
ncbi:MAG: hypothetical protein ABIH41_01880 [Nanoarchaeota archaeon]